MSKKDTFQVGRDAKNGQFITVEKAKQNPSKTVIETIKKAK